MLPVKQDAVQEIKDRLDLVDLVSEHLRLQMASRDMSFGETLRKLGRSWVGSRR